ncbi:MAG TPA: hypothetical protein DER18_04045 [Shewanella baltica]|nr:hypothetical protein [Shewanella baltica]
MLLKEGKLKKIGEIRRSIFNGINGILQSKFRVGIWAGMLNKKLETEKRQRPSISARPSRIWQGWQDSNPQPSVLESRRKQSNIKSLSCYLEKDTE